MLTPEQQAEYDELIRAQTQSPVTVEEIAQVNKIPTWKVAEGLANLIRQGRISAGYGNAEDVIAALIAQYPRPTS